MEYSGLAIGSQSAESQAQAVETRQAQRTASKAGRVQEAEDLKLQVYIISLWIQESPEDSITKGNGLFIKGDYLKAADLYCRAVEIHGPRPIFMSNLAAAYLKLEAYV